MPPKLALSLCFLLIIFLFISDSNKNKQVSRWIWIPQLWLLTVAGNPLSIWLYDIFGITMRHGSREQNILEGSPIDRFYYIFLILIGILILSKRRFRLWNFFNNNKLLILYFIYCGISVAWTDYPFVSFKRWIKEVGNLVMICIVFTDQNPLQAFKTIFYRLAYLFIPLSIVLYKYFPKIGRIFTRAGGLMVVGVTDHKNSLGALCLVVIIVFFWDHFLIKNSNKSLLGKKKSLLPNIIILSLSSWCLIAAHSATALFAVLLGCIMILCLNLSFIKNNINNIGLWFLGVAVLFVVLQYTVNILDITTEALGRDLTFTGRTRIWSTLLEIGTNPLIGSGYDSYWLGDRTLALRQRYVFPINQAHNGYLETYLNLGWIGLLLLLGSIISGYKKITTKLIHGFEFEKLRLVFLIIILFMNITEAYFKGLSIIWFVLLLVLVEIVPECTNSL